MVGQQQRMSFATVKNSPFLPGSKTVVSLAETKVHKVPESITCLDCFPK